MWVVHAPGSPNVARRRRMSASLPRRLRESHVVFELSHNSRICQDFREFTITNAARLHTRNNPGFFRGAVIEQAVAGELGLKTPVVVANA